MTADVAAAVAHLFIREHGAQRGTPVDGNLGLVREPALVELAEDPLRPLHVARVGRVDLAIPVVAESHGLQLRAEALDVLGRGLRGVLTRADRMLLRG
jgi:hypothetical protein